LVYFGKVLLNFGPQAWEPWVLFAGLPLFWDFWKPWNVSEFG